MQAAPLAALALALAAAGCAPHAEEPPLTPAEKLVLLEEHLHAEELRAELGREGLGARCATSTGVVRMKGRLTNHRATEGFDTRGCQ